MKRTNRVLAFDFGASSGRAILGTFDGERITLEEVHRFSNDPVRINGTLYWDVLRLFHEIKQGMLLAHHQGGFDSIGIDTWGVDFGLIDEHGCLLENPIHYRDQRTNGLLQRCSDWISNDQFYAITGNQFMEINTAYQLRSLVEQRPHLLERAHKLLLMPDLFNYLLTGEMQTEYTIASTTQLMDAHERIWSQPVIEALEIPDRLFTDIVQPNTIIGTLSDSIASELGIPPVPVISVASHDTQSAVMAVPTKDKDFVFISCGTWSLIGTELEQPLMN
ncbi:rhamnulokinase [Paenibacillus selenitireducens]|uniref:rhamnulokinase n=1 Tax=Paenibacillus selenitireducens TaxID=1324314 RepID=UPI0018E99EDA|nr:FGGY family carbohydrate kinase [Paenibacillus selenitireducens]